MLDISYQEYLQQGYELGGTEQFGQNIIWPFYYAGRLKTLSEFAGSTSENGCKRTDIASVFSVSLAGYRQG